MILPPYRTLTLGQAAAELVLDGPWQSSPWTAGGNGRLGDDLLLDHFGEDTPVLVFDGDLTVDSLEPRPYSTPKDAFDALLAKHEIIVVRGNLNVGVLRMHNLRALFVFGDVVCDKINFYAHHLAWIQGNLTARVAVLATSDQDGVPNPEAVGAWTVRVQGTASSPHVRNWWMRLGHLNWTPESGKDFSEDIELTEFNDQLSDPIW